MKSLSKRGLTWRLWLAAVAVFGAGCGVKTTHVVPAAQIRPSLDATKEQLLARYDGLARSVSTLNATITLVPRTGSEYSGVIEEYHEVNGFILAKRPGWIRVIGQAPVVGKDVFDMVSDGEEFRIFIPSKHKFIVGPTKTTREAKKPIENLRPQHLLEAIFWTPIPPEARVVMEEEDARHFYVLEELRGRGKRLEVVKKIWFDRADLSVSRIDIYGDAGRLESEIIVADWQAAGEISFPRTITLSRPHDDYSLGIRITKLTLNEPILEDKFKLEQPPGTELVRVGEEAADKTP
ncbi:MAG: LolA family protein [Candidatus Acidiferrales bacterium]